MVPNGNFETNTACSIPFINQLARVTGWYDYHAGTPDYFNACSSFSTYQIPSNQFGRQYPASGNAYVGFIDGLYNTIPNANNPKEYPHS